VERVIFFAFFACFPATWVSRVPSEEESQDSSSCNCLSQLQKEKFGHFFTHLLDWDKDSLISAQDFDALSEVNLMHVVMYRPSYFMAQGISLIIYLTP
jgi:hypothetical protein